MPLYEYKCSSCGDVFEIRQKFSDTPLSIHDTCGGALERLVSAPALQFKGSGWYVTDYGKGGSKPAANNGGEKGDKPAKSEKSEGSKGSKDSGAKSDSKSDSSSSTSTTPAKTE